MELLSRAANDKLILKILNITIFFKVCSQLPLFYYSKLLFMMTVKIMSLLSAKNRHQSISSKVFLAFSILLNGSTVYLFQHI